MERNTQNPTPLRQDWLDILFEHRNKRYGAYEIRRSYPKSIRRAIVGVTLSAGLLCGITFLRADHKTSVEHDVVMEVMDIKLPDIPKEKPIELPKPDIKMPITRPTITYLPPKLVDDDKVIDDDPLPTDDQLKDVDAGSTTQDGDPNAVVITDPTDDVGIDTRVIDNPKPVQVEIFDGFVEVMPEYPGGTQAMMKYIAENLRYPEIARESSIEGTVALSFVVDTDGNISDIQVIRDIGAGCGTEAAKVVRSMPKWKPGKQNGHTVKVRYKLPVRFRLQ